MANEDVKKITTIQDLLDMRLDKYTLKQPSNRNSEMLFCNHIEKDLKKIFEEIGYKVKNVIREFNLRHGRVDFIIQLENRKYVIVEVKYTPKEYRTTNDELVAMFAVGQLLTYKMIFCQQYEISSNDVSMCLLTNEEYIAVLNNIIFNKLPISYMIYGENGVKYYACE